MCETCLITLDGQKHFPEEFQSTAMMLLACQFHALGMQEGNDFNGVVLHGVVFDPVAKFVWEMRIPLQIL